MLTWWLQADVHFNEDDHYQQNLSLTLQAMAAETEIKIKVEIHKEIEKELNVIIPGQVGTWLQNGMRKLGVYSTGSGDILLRIIFNTSANTFLTADREARRLKNKLELALFDQFGLCMSCNLVKVSIIGVEGCFVPNIKDCVAKALVLLISTEDTPHEEILKEFHNYMNLQNYNTNEVNVLEQEFYANNAVLGASNLTASQMEETPDIETMEDEIYNPAELLELFDE